MSKTVQFSNYKAMHGSLEEARDFNFEEDWKDIRSYVENYHYKKLEDENTRLNEALTDQGNLLRTLSEDLLEKTRDFESLKSQLAEMTKNCISLFLHESRVTDLEMQMVKMTNKAEEMYHEMENMYLEEKNKYEALKKVVDELHHVRGLE